VTHGVLIENGKEAQLVNGVVIAGNFQELFRDGVETIGNDLRNSVGMGNVSVSSPTVKLAELTIAGK
jgi:predicted Zn-dependent protease